MSIEKGRRSSSIDGDWLSKNESREYRYIYQTQDDIYESMTEEADQINRMLAELDLEEEKLDETIPKSPAEFFESNGLEKKDELRYFDENQVQETLGRHR